jgi:hypothetical protein
MTQFTELLKGNLVDDAIEYRVHATRRMFQRHTGAEEVAFAVNTALLRQAEEEWERGIILEMLNFTA